MTSRVDALYYFKCLASNNNNKCKACKDTESILYTQGEKQSIETASEEAPTLDLLDKDFKSGIPKCSKTKGKHV